MDGRPQVGRTTAMGATMLAGGILAVLSALLPPPARGSEALVYAAGGLAIAGGAALILIRRPVAEAWLGVATAMGTALITITTADGGPGNGTADNEMLYVWICLYSFYFLRLPHALGQLALVGGAYAWLLGDQGLPADEATNQWLITLGTLLVAGLLVARLRSSVEAHVDELSDRARRDDLTGLLNRRELEERGAIELARRRREGTSLSVIALDIDGFKALNDTLGHPAGDKVLRRVSQILDGQTRSVDSVARAGGDEFVVLLPAARLSDAAAIAERLLLAMQVFGHEARVDLTASIGVATASATETLEDLWGAADDALYDAKREGGNQVVLASAAGAPVAG